MPAKWLTIDKDRVGQRLDNFLQTTLKKIPKSRIYRAIRKGEVRVNKGRVAASYRLREGDSVRIPPLVVPEKAIAPAPALSLRRWIESSIVYENQDLIVLDKPSGVPVHAGSGSSFGVQEVMSELRPKAACLELVHRLDKGTSGCLLLAKKRSVLRYLQQQFRERSVRKCYFALVKGRWAGGKKRVTLPLLKKEHLGGGRLVVVDPVNGKDAISVFRPVRHYRRATLMMVAIETGRTHQIRVHAQQLGHPIAGDDKYGDDDFNTWVRGLGLPGLFLHSANLSFRPPSGPEAVTQFSGIGVPMGQTLRRVLSKLD